MRLRGQENAAEGAATQLGGKREVAEGFADSGEARRIILVQKAMAIDENCQLGAPLRETAHDLRGNTGFSGLLPQANLFVNQADRLIGLIGELRVPAQIIFGAERFTATPALRHVSGELDGERFLRRRKSRYR
jgi:hypothetical protein